ncbi:MAG TPA: hypothetical protein VNU97_07225 [Rhizomicrobium sp.]|jgi:hypothetical protein|nr:hypothetical protein [Rhizomicrobium sp.]
MANTDSDPPVAHPTWYADIRHYFTQMDIDHMGAKGVDLATCQGVVAQLRGIFNC